MSISRTQVLAKVFGYYVEKTVNQILALLEHMSEIYKIALTKGDDVVYGLNQAIFKQILSK